MALPDFRIPATRHTQHTSITNVVLVGDAHNYATDKERMPPGSDIQELVCDSNHRIMTYAVGPHACTLYGEPAILIVGPRKCHDAHKYGYICVPNDFKSIDKAYKAFGLNDVSPYEKALGVLLACFRISKRSPKTWEELVISVEKPLPPTGWMAIEPETPPQTPALQPLVPLLLPHQSSPHMVPPEVARHVHALQFALTTALSHLNGTEKNGTKGLVTEIETFLGIDHG